MTKNDRVKVVFIYEGRPIKIKESKNSLSIVDRLKPKAKVEIEVNK
jgi:hypothetical protein